MPPSTLNRPHAPPHWGTHSDKHRTMNGWSAWSAGGISLSDPRAAPMYSSGAWPNGENHHDFTNHPSRPLSFSFASLSRHLLRYWPPFPNLFPSSMSSRRPSRSSSSSSVKFSLATAPAASTARFVLLCSLWYMTSALSSNTGKAIMIQFRYPITLTIVQFGFVALYCLLCMSPLIPISRLRMPTRAIVSKTLPMGMFQVGGHVFSSVAISRIPVSTVHTIKALSPLFTVAAYALLYGVSYSPKTYISLFPLTIGVMLACSFDMSASNAIGLLCAFGSALVFVSSNIFFKKIMPSESEGTGQLTAHKLDKLNLLFYSSCMAFLLMIPIWLLYDLPGFYAAQSNPEHVAHPNHGHTTPHSVPYYFFMNGTVHFAQNLIAFVILASTSPVTYSIASLIKRVAVICIAIVWFSQSVHPVQGIGITMTFAGLYMYNTAKSDVQRGESKMRRVEAARGLVLPSNKADARVLDGAESPPPERSLAETTGMKSASVYGRPRGPSSATLYTPFTKHAPPPPPLPLPLPLARMPPSLTIQTTPVTAKVAPSTDWRLAVSPVDSYPSPPPSLDDSPPRDPVPLPLEYGHGHGHGNGNGHGHRQGHGHGHGHEPRHGHGYKGGCNQEGLVFDGFPLAAATVSA